MILVLRPLEGGVDAQQRKFGPEDDKVELLGGQIIVHDRRWKSGNMVDQLMPGIGIDLRPGFPGTILFHIAAVWPDQKIVEAHS